MERAEAAREEAAVGGGGAGSLTPNSLLGDSSSQSLDTSHGNHGPEMSDSLWQAGSRAAAGARVSRRPGPRPPTASESLPPWVPQPLEASLRLSLAPPPCPGSVSSPHPGGCRPRPLAVAPGRLLSAEARPAGAARTWGGGVSGARGPV